jgi:hypothetical protein
VGRNVTQEERTEEGQQKEKKWYFSVLSSVLKYLLFAVAENSDELFLCNF